MEKSIYWQTNGVGDGSAGGYSASDVFDVYRSLFTGISTPNFGGVAPDYLNKLAVSGTSSPVSVGSGAAIVYGIPYLNSSTVTVAVPTPTTATRIDRIVLRANWSAQTVRVTRIAGTEGGAAPSLTQGAGVTWDVPLAQVAITTSGVITVTDERQFISTMGDANVSTVKLADSSVTTSKVADGAVTSAKIADGTISTGDMADNAVNSAKLASNSVTTVKIADGNVTTTKIADGNVTAAKVADDAIGNAKLANMAQATIKGRATDAGTGDPVDLTAAQLIDIIETVDGSGSGVDADLLDGQHASAFAAASHTHSGTQITDGTITAAKLANAIIDSTKLADNAATNGKLADMAQYCIKGRASSGTGDPEDLTAAQVIDVLETADGSGSGLDADLLDGNHASAFATSSHVHTTAWQNLSLAAGCSAGAYGTPQYRKNGDAVEFRGWVTLSGSGSALIATLPSGHVAADEPVQQCVISNIYYWVSGGQLFIYNQTASIQYDLSCLRFCVTA